MIKVNNSPILTCQNYGINNFEMDTKDIRKKSKKFETSSFDTLKKNRFYKAPTKILEQQDNLQYNIMLNDGQAYLPFKFSKNNDYLVESLVFSLKPYGKSELILDYSSLEDSYHNCGLKFVCKENSNLNVLLICDSVRSINLMNIYVEILENAHCNFTIIDFCSGKSIYKFVSDLRKNNGEVNLKTIYFGDDKAKIDLNYVFNIYGKSCNTSMDVVGALSGSSQKNFKGDIDFKKGAKTSKGTEKEFCLLLSNCACSKALPMLICSEEDVEGSHSSSTGRIDKGVLFYLMSRGLSKQEAIKLYVKSSFSSVLRDVPQNLKTRIEEIIDRKIENEEL